MTLRFFLLLIFGLLALSPAGASQRDQRFKQLLAETGMEVAVPSHFNGVAFKPNHIFPFDRVWRNAKAGMEIRVAVRPLARMQIEYNDPHSSAPNPEHVYPLVFQSLIGQLARGGAMPSRVWPTDKAKELFNADWASAAMFDADPLLDSVYKNALLLALHKTGVGDGYVLVLFADTTNSKVNLHKVLSVLRFRNVTSAKNTPIAK